MDVSERSDTLPAGGVTVQKTEGRVGSCKPPERRTDHSWTLLTEANLYRDLR